MIRKTNFQEISYMCKMSANYLKIKKMFVTSVFLMK